MNSFRLPLFRLLVAICALAWASCGGRSELDESFYGPAAGQGGRGGKGGGGPGPGGMGGSIAGAAGFAGSFGGRVPFCGDGICDPGEQGRCLVDCPNNRCGNG